ncbi:hypothetical protein Tco_0014221 [Tanacetum coccineum]
MPYSLCVYVVNASRLGLCLISRYYCSSAANKGQVADIIKEDLWTNPLTYFNYDADEEEFNIEEDEEEWTKSMDSWMRNSVIVIGKADTGQLGLFRGFQWGRLIGVIEKLNSWGADKYGSAGYSVWLITPI